MQVSVEAISELMRIVTVQVPEDKIQSEISKRLQTLSQKARIDGFRPGKIPGSVIKKRFAKPVRKEVLAELVQSSLYEALTDEKLQPAGVPAIEQKDPGEDGGLEFVAKFEIYPEIELKPFEEIQISRPVYTIAESNIDATIEKLRTQKTDYHGVERAVKSGDQVKISFSGVCNEENFTDGRVEDYSVVVGGNTMIPGFEEALINMETGVEKVFSLDFPDDYQSQKLAGNTAEFTVCINTVEEAVLPEVDEKFIQSYGIGSGDLTEFRSEIKNRMKDEADRVVGSKTKHAVMDALLENNTVTLPNVIVDQEIDQLKKSSQSAHGGEIEPEASEEQLGQLEKEARRRVNLGLLLAEIIKTNSLKADPGKVRTAIENLARGYESPDEVVNWYYSNSEQLKNVEHMVLEEQAIDLVLGGASVTDENVDFDRLTDQETL